ncbi:hypothetical protein UPYG_G00314840 [Umbra pygmaea]|uniref:Claudin n=1 Tax=Umbra pygmaea TaxID=75934 RepID=A0ABD0WMS0_UMBPY
MNYRSVVMYLEIGCFVVCLTGWILVCSTMPIEMWTWSEVYTMVLTTSQYYSNLWKDCASDLSGVHDCKPIPSLLALNWDIHMCRALIITSIILGFFGDILVLVGMKCTKIGGSEIANARVTFAGGINYLVSGLCSMIAFSYYGNKVRAEFQDPNFKARKFEIGVGVYIGWGGSTLLIIGGLLYTIFGWRDGCQSSSMKESMPVYKFPGTYVAPQDEKTYISASTALSVGETSMKTERSRSSRDTRSSRSNSSKAIPSFTAYV